MSLPDFVGKQVVVTGASRGIGRGIAEAFLGAGAGVRIIADDPQVIETGAAIGAEARIADITDARAVGEALADLSHIDVLVNNAGLERLTPVDGPSPETETMFRRIVDINISGTFIVTRAALPMMTAGGRIINTASVWSRSVEPLFAGYVSSKHAVIGLTKTLAKELGPRGITVNAVCPGWVKTEASLRSLKAMSARSGRPEQELLDDDCRDAGIAGFHGAGGRGWAISVLRVGLGGECHGPERRCGSWRGAVVSALAGRRAIVTGAGSGIGRAAAAELARQGAGVVGLDINPADGLDIVLTDVSDAEAVARGVSAAVARLGGLDIVVNAAGVMHESPLVQFDYIAFERMVAVNITGTVRVVQAALAHLGPGSRIVNVASELAFLGRQQASGYAATKGAILSLTRSWARELAPGILVNAVAPGPVDTPLLGFGAMSAAQQALETNNPLGRIGTPEEIAVVIAFLASPAASFITGQCFSADGGAAMH